MRSPHESGRPTLSDTSITGDNDNALRAELERLRQEHRDLDDAIAAMDAVPADSAGALALSFALENRGNVYHYPTGWLQVRPAGQAGGFEEKLPLRVLLPGTETVYQTLWNPPASGTYQFVVTLDLGLDSLVQGVKEFTVGPEALEIVPPPIDASPALPGGVDPRRP